MGLLDVLNGMQNGPRGQRRASVIALLTLVGSMRLSN
jgi:hypothetical protein